MKFLGTLKAFMLALVVLAPTTPVSAAEVKDSLGSFLLETPVTMTRPIVNFCLSEVPGSADELEAEYETFISKVVEAARPLHEKLASDPQFAGQVPQEMREQVNAVGEKMLLNIKDRDPKSYCTSLITRMREASVEQLKMQIEGSYQAYMQSAGLVSQDE